MANATSRLNAALAGRYSLERKLGEGGTATVYLARDVRHDRRVALKVLKPELAAVVGAERFLAEIKTTANLQHPHILPLFDSGQADGMLFYVMPYVEGESLRDRLNRERQLPVDQAIGIAADVATALDYAHSRGVIHRDIKPENILLHEGRPLVSDFGIALAVSAGGGGRLTETGLSLGTPHYMSPEQATGDTRIGPTTDIWALGCVLYEMFVGEPPYTGTSPQAILGRIVTADPASAAKHRTSVAANADAAIRRALEKVPADRFTTARDFHEALLDPTFGKASSAEQRAFPTPRHAVVPIVATAIALVIGVWVGRRTSRGSEDPGPRVHFVVELPPGNRLPSISGLPSTVAISPDGTRFVYTVRRDGIDRLVSRDLSDVEASEIPGTEGGQGPFFSPDGRSIGFFADGQLKRVDLLTGTQVTIAEVANPLGGSWGDDGRIVYASWGSALRAVSEDGGGPAPLGSTFVSLNVGDVSPDILAGGRGVLYSSAGRIELIESPGSQPRFVVEGDTPFLTDDGLLVFARGSTLLSATFDPVSLSLGEPIVIAEGVRRTQGWLHVAVSRNGTFVYAASEPPRRGQLGWVTRDGTWQAITEPGRITHPRLAPDGSRVAFNGVEARVTVRDLVRGTDDVVAEGSRAVWARDSQRLVFSRAGDLYSVSVSARDAQPFRVIENDPALFPLDWSIDGSTFVFSVADPTNSRDIWTLTPGEEPRAFVATTADERSASMAPNGEWMTFAVLETGRSERVYIDRFPEGGSRTLVASSAVEPRWSPLGDEIFYRSLDGREMWRVPVDMGSGALGSPMLLFSGPYYPSDTGFFADYDVSSDGRRFLMVRQDDDRDPDQLHVVVNGARR